MATPSKQAEFDSVAGSAFASIESGIRHMWDDAPDGLRYAAIDFFAGLDLLLKSRLMAEHWALVINDVNTAHREAYFAGRAATVSLAQACDRLDKIAGLPVSKEAFAKFEALRHTRNKAAHFRLPEDIDPKTLDARRSALAARQVAGWDAMHDMLTGAWKGEFAGFARQIAAIDASLERHRATSKAA